MRKTADERAADRRLVGQFLRSRSESHFRRLYRRETPRMLRLATRLVAGSTAAAEDVVQEAWIRAVAALPRFEWRSSLASWLGGFVKNVAREHRRRDRHHAGTADTAEDSGGDDALAEIEVSRALESLPPGFRSVVVLHDVAGFTHEEIGSRLGIEPGTSKSQLARARARLRLLLGQEPKE